MPHLKLLNYVLGEGKNHSMHAENDQQLRESVLSSHAYVGPRDQTQGARVSQVPLTAEPF